MVHSSLWGRPPGRQTDNLRSHSGIMFRSSLWGRPPGKQTENFRSQSGIIPNISSFENSPRARHFCITNLCKLKWPSAEDRLCINVVLQQNPPGKHHSSPWWPLKGHHLSRCSKVSVSLANICSTQMPTAAVPLTQAHQPLRSELFLSTTNQLQHKIRCQREVL